MNNSPSPLCSVRACDSELAGTAIRALHARQQLRHRPVTIQANRGILTLRGTVRSYYERQLLIHAVNKAIQPLGEAGIVDEVSVNASAGA